MRRVVVVGASLAGVHAIEGLRDGGFGGEIVLVGAEAHLPYDRPPLSKEALHHGTPIESILLREEGWYASRQVQLQLGTAAVALDPRARTVSLADGQDVGYDGLVIATGSAPRAVRPESMTGSAHVLRTFDDCVALRERLRPGRNLVVIGAGFIGLEVAATACELGLEVSVVEIAPVPLARSLGDEVGVWFRRRHAAHGVDLHCGVGVSAIEGDGGSSKVRLRDGTVLHADVVVVGIGAVPATGWLAGSGVAVGDGVVCDEHLRTSVPGVVAAGDVARWLNPLFDEQMRVEHWTNAVEQGRQAAAALLGHSEAAYAPVPYFWSDQFDARIAFVGRANAADDMHVRRSDDSSLVVLFGRDDVVRGALCVNAPRDLVRYRTAILDQVPWLDAVRA